MAGAGSSKSPPSRKAVIKKGEVELRRLSEELQKVAIVGPEGMEILKEEVRTKIGLSTKDADGDESDDKDGNMDVAGKRKDEEGNGPSGATADEVQRAADEAHRTSSTKQNTRSRFESIPPDSSREPTARESAKLVSDEEGTAANPAPKLPQSTPGEPAATSLGSGAKKEEADDNLSEGADSEAVRKLKLLSKVERTKTFDYVFHVLGTPGEGRLREVAIVRERQGAASDEKPVSKAFELQELIWKVVIETVSVSDYNANTLADSLLASNLAYAHQILYGAAVAGELVQQHDEDAVPLRDAIKATESEDGTEKEDIVDDDDGEDKDLRGRQSILRPATEEEASKLIRFIAEKFVGGFWFCNRAANLRKSSTLEGWFGHDYVKEHVQTVCVYASDLLKSPHFHSVNLFDRKAIKKLVKRLCARQRLPSKNTRQELLLINMLWDYYDIVGYNAAYYKRLSKILQVVSLL